MLNETTPTITCDTEADSHSATDDRPYKLIGRLVRQHLTTGDGHVTFTVIYHAYLTLCENHGVKGLLRPYFLLLAAPYIDDLYEVEPTVDIPQVKGNRKLQRGWLNLRCHLPLRPVDSFAINNAAMPQTHHRKHYYDECFNLPKKFTERMHQSFINEHQFKLRKGAFVLPLGMPKPIPLFQRHVSTIPHFDDTLEKNEIKDADGCIFDLPL